MGTLYLVRHGQASFGADDYDRLSDLGARQSERLGQYLAGKGLTFDAALCGTLRRQVDTCGGILRLAIHFDTNSEMNEPVMPITADIASNPVRLPLRLSPKTEPSRPNSTMMARLVPTKSAMRNMRGFRG